MHQRNQTQRTSASRDPVPSQVFLCYCHQDRRFAQRLLVHLASCQQTSHLAVWDDSQILPGSLWKHEVAHALSHIQMAILLVSADFLASPFISMFELPRLLAAAHSSGTRILPVIVRPCLFEESPLAPFHAVNPPTRPLSQLSTSAREHLWVDLVRLLLHTHAPPPSSP